MSTTIIPFLQEASFDAEATHVICEAFDIACDSTMQSAQTALVKEIIAKRIIKLARDGNWPDAQALAARTLASLGLPDDWQAVTSVGD